MTLRIVRLGTKRARGERLRIGAVQYPPRGFPKSRHSLDDWYDVWLPDLAPAPELVSVALHASTDRDWKAFSRSYRTGMKVPQRARVLDLLAALSHLADFFVGCYCADESRCHRSLLRKMLEERGAKLG